MLDRTIAARLIFALSSTIAMLILGGCSMFQSSNANTYPQAMTPPPPAPDTATQADKKPTAVFPATVAIVRVEVPKPPPNAPPLSTQGYRVVFTRNVEKPELMERLAKLPLLASFETLSRLELPDGLTTEAALRSAAAGEHADLLLIYRFDDSYDDHDTMGWKTVVTAGIAPTKKLVVTSTASAVLVDARTGYLYGTAEASSDKSSVSSCWSEDAAADSSRQDAEAAAFERLVPEMEKSWMKVIHQYANNNPLAPPTTQR